MSVFCGFLSTNNSSRAIFLFQKKDFFKRKLCYFSFFFLFLILPFKIVYTRPEDALRGWINVSVHISGRNLKWCSTITHFNLFSFCREESKTAQKNPIEFIIECGIGSLTDWESARCYLLRSSAKNTKETERDNKEKPAMVEKCALIGAHLAASSSHVFYYPCSSTISHNVKCALLKCCVNINLQQGIKCILRRGGGEKRYKKLFMLLALKPGSRLTLMPLQIEEVREDFASTSLALWVFSTEARL